MSAHTPGPWQFENDRIVPVNPSRIVSVIADLNTGVMVKRSEDVGYTMEEMNSEIDANIRVMTAAPDLLAAAKQAQCECSLTERESGHRVGCWMPNLSAAIEKAAS